MGFFLGMVANLAPSPAAGVGTLDAGLIGAFLLFDIPIDTVLPRRAHVPHRRLLAADHPGCDRLLRAAQAGERLGRWRGDVPYTLESKVTAEAK